MAPLFTLLVLPDTVEIFSSALPCYTYPSPKHTHTSRTLVLSNTKPFRFPQVITTLVHPLPFPLPPAVPTWPGRPPASQLVVLRTPPFLTCHPHRSEHVVSSKCKFDHVTLSHLANRGTGLQLGNRCINATTNNKTPISLAPLSNQPRCYTSISLKVGPAILLLFGECVK